MLRNLEASNKIIHSYVYQYPLELISSSTRNINSIMSNCHLTQP